MFLGRDFVITKGQSMMDQTKLQNLLAAMNQAGVPQMVISDPAMILYLTGVSMEPGERMLVLVLRRDGKHRFFINELFPQTRELGAPITYYNDTQDGVALMVQALLPGQTVAIDKIWPARFLLRLQELHSGKCINASPIADGVRAIKTPEEQEKMRTASLLNDGVMAKIVAASSESHTETELSELLLQYYLEAGCEGYSFSPITAFGGNAADPHHVTDGTTGKRGDCLVLDIGGKKDNYCSDMTRTVFLGEVSPRQREIYEIVKEANRRGIAAAKPGNRMCDVDKAARDYITQQGYGPYFTHRTGHSIGLEVHETGDVSAVNEAIIQPGQCFSVEPGIYLPQEGIGVRIEDLVLITETGCEVLNHYPKDLTVIPYLDN